jgi:hypothetical protein
MAAEDAGSMESLAPSRAKSASTSGGRSVCGGGGWGVKVSLHARQWLAGAARYTSGGGEEERERRENCSEEVGLLAAAVVATEHPAARLGSGEAKLGVRA